MHDTLAHAVKCVCVPESANDRKQHVLWGFQILMQLDLGSVLAIK